MSGFRSFALGVKNARRRFARDRSGVAAVEFALVAAPFFFMLFAVLEVAMVFFAGAALDHAATEAARDIRTGRFQTAGGGAEEFREAICGRSGALINCNRLSFDIRTFEDFEAVEPADPFDDEGEIDEDNFEFEPGGEREIVLVRVFYDWQVVTPVLGAGFANLPGNRRLLTAAVAFRNEPYGG